MDPIENFTSVMTGAVCVLAALLSARCRSSWVFSISLALALWCVSSAIAQEDSATASVVDRMTRQVRIKSVSPFIMNQSGTSRLLRSEIVFAVPEGVQVVAGSDARSISFIALDASVVQLDPLFLQLGRVAVMVGTRSTEGASSITFAPGPINIVALGSNNPRDGDEYALRGVITPADWWQEVSWFMTGCGGRSSLHPGRCVPETTLGDVLRFGGSLLDLITGRGVGEFSARSLSDEALIAELSAEVIRLRQRIEGHERVGKKESGKREEIYSLRRQN